MDYQNAKLRIAALRAASKVSTSPTDLLNSAFAYECYLILGFNTADGVLRRGPAVLQAAADTAPQPAGNYFDRFDGQAAAAAETPADRYVDYLDKLETSGPSLPTPTKLH